MQSLFIYRPITRQRQAERDIHYCCGEYTGTYPGCISKSLCYNYCIPGFECKTLLLANYEFLQDHKQNNTCKRERMRITMMNTTRLVRNVIRYAFETVTILLECFASIKHVRTLINSQQ